MTEEKQKRGRKPDDWWTRRYKAYKKACECDAPDHIKARLKVLEDNKHAGMNDLDYYVMG